MDNTLKIYHCINIHSSKKFKSDVGLGTVCLKATLLKSVWTSLIKVSAQLFSRLNYQSAELIASNTERTTQCVGALEEEEGEVKRIRRRRWKKERDMERKNK
jgi:hypothetical protein